MSSLASPKQAFRLKLSPTLLSQLVIEDVSPDECIEFFAAQFQNIIACKPNFKGSTPEKPVWFLRGYYPNTSVFFKMTVVKTGTLTLHDGTQCEESFNYYVKVTELKVTPGKTFRSKVFMNGGFISIYSDAIMKRITEGMENSVLAAEHEIKSLVPAKLVRPKAMSPKGYEAVPIR
jgi:hypothetical protein